MDATNDRVGINKTPSTALDVEGDAAISGDLTVSTDATVNGVVTINANSSAISNGTGLFRVKDTYGHEIILGNGSGTGIHHLVFIMQILLES